MKKSGNRRWILILMIMSQLMLTVLVIQWLRSQWKDEKEKISDEISLKFSQSIDQVLDTMLVKHLIKPALGSDSARDRLYFNTRISSPLAATHQGTIIITNDTLLRNPSSLTVTMPDKSHLPATEEVMVSFRDSTEKKILLRSVKMIIKRTEDTINHTSGMSHIFAAVPDTSMLRKLLTKKLIAEGHGLRMKLIENLKAADTNRANMLYFSSDFIDRPVSVGITNYRSIILKNLSPQIIFAASLLLLTAAAFFLAFRSIRRQEELNIIRNEFINNITHELKTPVSTVIVAIEALRDRNRLNDKTGVAEYLDLAGGEMRRLDNLVSRVLSTSRLENSSDYLITEPTDITDLTDKVIESFKVRLAKEEASITFLHPDDKLVLEIDRLHIEGVLYNLIDNSLKYSDKNPHIEIKIWKNKNNIFIRLADNGPGIPPEYIGRVFEKFFRVPTGDIHNIKGYGLGLSFADLVMRQHSGSIEVRNLKEGGCEFVLHFSVKD